MISAFFSALIGRCPGCGRGALYKSFLRLNDTCPVCHVRFERWSGSWTIPAVMGYGSGAMFAIVLGYIFHRTGRLEGSENILIPTTVAFTALFYPVCKNVSMFMLFQNGFIFVDPPTLLQDPPSNPEEEPLSTELPLLGENDPTLSEERPPNHDEPTDNDGRAA